LETKRKRTPFSNLLFWKMDYHEIQIEDLNDDILIEIFKILPLSTQLLASRVCKRWRFLLSFPEFHRHLDFAPYFSCNPYNRVVDGLGKPLGKIMERPRLEAWVFSSTFSLFFARCRYLPNPTISDAVVIASPSLKRLDLSETQKPNNKHRQLNHDVNNNNNNQQLNNHHQGLIPAMYEGGNSILGTICSWCVNLRHLDLRDIKEPVTDEILIAIAQRNPLLESISVGWKKESKIGGNFLVNTAEFTKYTPNLVILNLGGCVELRDIALINIAAHCPDLTELDINYAFSVTDFGVAAAAKGLSKLERLNLRCAAGLTDEAVIEVAGHLPMLRHLNLSCISGITDISVFAVLNGCPLLESLDLCYCTRLSSDAVLAVCRQKEGQILKEIGLSGLNLLTDEILAEILERNGKTLTTLSVGACSRLTEKSLRLIPDKAPHLESLMARELHHIADAVFILVSINLKNLKRLVASVSREGLHMLAMLKKDHILQQS